MNRARLVTVLVLWTAALVPAMAWAQYGSWEHEMGLLAAPAGGAVTGTGTVIVRRPPTILRMSLLLSGKGKTAEEAVAALKARRETATAELVKLGADKKSVDVTSPSVSAPENQRRRQLEMMIRQRMRASGRTAKPPKLPQTVTVAAMLTAEWRLTTKDPEEVFLFVQDLREKVKAAKLAGGKEAEKPSPEEDEMTEEMQAEMGFPGEEEFDPNTPMFLYVAKVSEEDRVKALAEAFQKAKADAQRIAQAAGIQLGPLAGLSAGDTGGFRGGSGYDDEPMPSGYQQTFERFRSMMFQEPKENEAMASNPGHVTFSVVTRATFSLAKEKEAAAKPK